MPVQLLYPAKFSITIDGETKIFYDKNKFTQSLHKFSPTKDNRWKTQIQRRKLHPRKSKKVIFQQIQKKDCHTNIIPPLTKKIAGSNNHYSLISVNINGLNLPIQRHRLTDWILKKDPAFSCINKTHFSVKERHYLRVKGWKTNFPSKWSQETCWSSHSNIG